MKIAIRTEATVKIGLGHVSRMLALADELEKSTGDIHFIINDYTVARELVESKGYRIIMIDSDLNLRDWKSELEHQTGGIKFDCMVVDLYTRTSDMIESYKQHCKALVLIDDLCDLDRYNVNLLINGNVYAEDLDYPVNGRTQRLLGASYTIIREAFRNIYDVKKVITDSPNRILITFGGSDPENLTLRLVDLLSDFETEFKSIDVVAGNGYTDFVNLKARILDSPHIRLHRNVTDMENFMISADMAVSAAGTTTYELVSMGVPTILISAADNQDQIGKAMAKKGAALFCGKYRQISDQDILDTILRMKTDTGLRKKLSMTGKKIIDCRGPERIRLAIEKAVRSA